MNIGNIVHAAAEFDFPNLEARTAFAQARLRSNDFEAPWQETAVRAKVDELVRNLSAYLHRVTLGGGALLGAERAFTVEVRVEGEESAKITLRGKIDRIESTAAGSIDVVDFKTGKSMPSSDSMATNAQLAAYQLALSTGAVSDPVDRPVQAVELPRGVIAGRRSHQLRCTKRNLSSSRSPRQNRSGASAHSTRSMRRRPLSSSSVSGTSPSA